MPRPVEQLLALLRTGVKTAKELQQALGVSQPTLSRLLAGMGGQVVALGRARQTRYGLPRDVRGAGGEFPVYRISPSGDAEAAGTLLALQGGEYWWQPAAGSGELLRHVPWFIQDLRPDGFPGKGQGDGGRNDRPLWGTSGLRGDCPADKSPGGSVPETASPRMIPPESQTPGQEDPAGGWSLSVQRQYVGMFASATVCPAANRLWACLIFPG